MVRKVTLRVHKLSLPKRPLPDARSYLPPDRCAGPHRGVVEELLVGEHPGEELGVLEGAAPVHVAPRACVLKVEANLVTTCLSLSVVDWLELTNQPELIRGWVDGWVVAANQPARIGRWLAGSLVGWLVLVQFIPVNALALWEGLLYPRVRRWQHRKDSHPPAKCADSSKKCAARGVESSEVQSPPGRKAWRCTVSSLLRRPSCRGVSRSATN